MKLVGLLFAVAAALQGCTHRQPKAVADDPILLIDYGRMTATAPGWSYPLRDCSNEELECIEAEGRFLIAFPRKCPNQTHRWEIEGRALRMTAPAPHYDPPSGGYFYEKYPYVYLSYRAGVGFVTLWVQSKPVLGGNWGFPSTADYSLRFAGKDRAFVCKEATSQ